MEKDADEALHPASNIKLLTSAAGLDILGPRYQWKTDLHTFSRNGSTIDSLIISGSGDPSIQLGHLSEWSAKLKGLGIKSIRGDIILDSRSFTFNGLPPGFADKNQDGAYRPALSSLNLNWNHIQITVIDRGHKKPHISVYPPSNYVSVRNESTVNSKVKRPIRIQMKRLKNRDEIRVSGQLKRKKKRTFRRRITRPLLFFGESMRTQLQRSGITFNGAVKFGGVEQPMVRLLRHESSPFVEIMRAINTWSNNLRAETVVLSIAQLTEKRAEFEAGITRIRRFAIEQLGWSDFTQTNGSGLFGHTRVSARQLTTLLSYMYQREDHFPDYRSSFAIAGVDGTMKHRLKTLGQTRVYAKTGTLDGISGLSGYLVFSDDRVVAFSILQNGFKGSAKPIRGLQDRVIREFIKTYESRAQIKRKTKP